MTLNEITEIILRLPNGGVVNTNDGWDQGYIEVLINTYRARYLKAMFAGNKRINPVCYQKHYPEYEELLQDEDGCNVKFRHPEVISLDDRNDGFRYIGSPDCNNNFARIQSRAWLSTFNDNRTTKINTKRRTSVLYDGSAQILEVYGNPELDELMTESLVSNPRDIPTWNADEDQYPLSQSDINDVVGIIYNENVLLESRIVVGNSKGVDLPKQRPQ